jgi:hypothetical protein
VLPSMTIWVIEKVQVRRLRRESLRLVKRDDDNLDRGTAHARFALLRALRLEREMRAVSLLRQREAMASLTRGVIESALIGLYLTCDAAGLDRMDAQTRRHIQRLIDPWLPDGENLTQRMADLVGAGDGPGMVDLRQVAHTVDEVQELGQVLNLPVGEYLYRHWYVPLSNLAVHTSLASLSRHRSIGGAAVLSRPWGVLPRRGAIRVADGSIALLAAVISEKGGQSAPWLRRYGAKQLGQANVPAAVLFLQITRGMIRYMGFRRVARLIAAGRRFARPGGGEAVQDANLRRFTSLVAPPGVDPDQLVELLREMVGDETQESAGG